MRILSTKKLLVSGLAAISFVLAGCLTDDSGDEGPDITTNPVSQTKVVGDTATFSVVATGSGTLTYTWVRLSAGSSTYDTLATETASTLKIVSAVAQDGAAFKCVVKDSKGIAVSTSGTLTVTGTAYGTDMMDSLGAQAAGPGSALDLDSGKVWQSGTANLNQAKIDLVYLYYGGVGDSAASLNGALAAKDSGVKYNINLTNSYTAALDIKLVKVTAKPSSQHHAKYAYDNGTKLRSVRVVAGDKFVVLTTGGKYAYIEVTSVSGTTAGTAKITFNIGTI
jgi:hypothetical protein